MLETDLSKEYNYYKIYGNLKNIIKKSNIIIKMKANMYFRQFERNSINKFKQKINFTIKNNILNKILKKNELSIENDNYSDNSNDENI